MKWTVRSVTLVLASLTFGGINAVAAAAPKTHTLILSGGGTPASNHYSQYLQTKTLTDGMRKQLGESSVDVLFGAGNNLTTPNVLADVHRQTSTDGTSYPDTIFGVIDHNQAAIMPNVENWFEGTGGRLDADAEAFFLFVSDHGMPNRNQKPQNRYNDNCIDLWAYDADTTSELPWDQRCLSQSKLKKLIKTNIPTKKTVFAMSQCFSGGFHQMSVSRKNGYPAADANLCGFTAITEDETASGCTPDVDGPGYKGYERFFTQQITGTDVVTGQPMPYQRKQTVKEAHYAASAEDVTKDIPLSTSDFYLNQWANLIYQPKFSPRTDAATKEPAQKIFQQVIDQQVDDARLATLSGPLAAVVTEKQTHLRAQERLLAGLHPGLAGVITTGTLTDLLKTRSQLQRQMQAVNGQLETLSQTSEELYQSKILLAWVDAMKDEATAPLKGLAYQLEKQVLLPNELEGNGTGSSCTLILSLLLTRGNQDGYKTTRDLCGQRSTLILDHAVKQGIITEVDRYKTANLKMELLYKNYQELSEANDHIRRIIILRSTLAAAVALTQMNDSQAIQDVLGLNDCESTRF